MRARGRSLRSAASACRLPAPALFCARRSASPRGNGRPAAAPSTAGQRRALLSTGVRRNAAAAGSSGGDDGDGDGADSKQPTIGGDKYKGFEPGREWVPLDPDRIAKGDLRRSAQRSARRRWERMRRPSSGASVAVVCHGNIARSQVFAHFIDARAKACQLPLSVSSCGVADEDAYTGWRELVDETQRRLSAATPPGLPPPQLTRNYWTEAVASQLMGATLIVAADAGIQTEVSATPLLWSLFPSVIHET